VVSATADPTFLYGCRVSGSCDTGCFVLAPSLVVDSDCNLEFSELALDRKKSGVMFDLLKLGILMLESAMLSLIAFTLLLTMPCTSSKRLSSPSDSTVESVRCVIKDSSEAIFRSWLARDRTGTRVGLAAASIVGTFWNEEV